MPEAPSSKRSWLGRALRWLLILVCILILGAAIAGIALRKPRPQGAPGVEAEALAQLMLQSVNAAAWKETGAVRFTFMNHRHLWDRRRGYDRIESGSRRVLLRISDQTGRVWENEAEVAGDRATKLVRDGYAQWVNDSFWLNPVVKIYDKGVTRSLVRDQDGGARLLVEYSSGGVTPGDAYLWTPGAGASPPTQWRMWVHVIPIGGLAASWEHWTDLSTGARVATLHRMGPFTLELKDVAGARTLAELLNSAEDPFAILAQSTR